MIINYFKAKTEWYIIDYIFVFHTQNTIIRKTALSF